MAGAVTSRYRKPFRLAAVVADASPELDDRSAAAGPTTAPRPAISSAEIATAQTAGSRSAETAWARSGRAEAEYRGDRDAGGISAARLAVRPSSKPRASGACATVSTN